MKIVDAVLMSKVKSVSYYQPKLTNDNFFIEFSVNKKKRSQFNLLLQFFEDRRFCFLQITNNLQSHIYSGSCYSVVIRLVLLPLFVCDYLHYRF